MRDDLHNFMIVLCLFLVLLACFCCYPVAIVNKQPGVWEPIEDEIHYLLREPACAFEQIALLEVGKYQSNKLLYVTAIARSIGANAIIASDDLEFGASLGFARLGVAAVFSLDKSYFLAVRLEEKCKDLRKKSLSP